MMLGTISDDTFNVEMLVSVDYKANKDSVSYSEMVAYKKAKESGLQVIGSIHSHTHGYFVPSPTDISESMRTKETISGICYISKKNGKLRSKIKFWHLLTIRELS